MASLSTSVLAMSLWQQRLDDLTLALVENADVIAETISRDQTAIRLYGALNKNNRVLNRFLAQLDEEVRNIQIRNFEFAGSSTDSAKSIPILSKMQGLYTALDEAHANVMVSNLIGQRFTKAEIRLFGLLNERLLDYMVWLRDVGTEKEKEYAEISFAAGFRELEAGELIAPLLLTEKALTIKMRPQASLEFGRLDELTQKRTLAKLKLLARDPLEIMYGKPLLAVDRRTSRIGRYQILFAVVDHVLLITDISARKNIYPFS